MNEISIIVPTAENKRVVYVVQFHNKHFDAWFTWSHHISLEEAKKDLKDGDRIVKRTTIQEVM